MSRPRRRGERLQEHHPDKTERPSSSLLWSYLHKASALSLHLSKKVVSHIGPLLAQLVVHLLGALFDANEVNHPVVNPRHFLVVSDHPDHFITSWLKKAFIYIPCFACSLVRM